MSAKMDIMEAYIDLYEKYGDIRKINIKELTERSGYSRSTFYTHFKDIYDVRETIEEYLMKETAEDGPLYVDYFLNNNADGSMQKLVQRLIEHWRWNCVITKKGKDERVVNKYRAVFYDIYKSYLPATSISKMTDYTLDTTVNVFLKVFGDRSQDKESVEESFESLLEFCRKYFDLYSQILSKDIISAQVLESAYKKKL